MATAALSRDLQRELESIAGREAVLTRPGELLSFESDGLTAYRATPAAVVFVHDTVQLRRLVAALRRARLPFVPRGAGTGLSGGALADNAVILELSRMNRILAIDPENRRAVVQPGVINSELARAAAAHGLMYAPDPSSQTACTLGGNVAENSGGPHCLKYGVTTNHVLALTVVTPEGGLVRLNEPGRAGYDLTGLFVGSEGTLGICSEIELRLVPAPAAVETLLAHFETIESASRAVSAIIAAGILPAALEMIDQNTLRAVEASVYAAGFPTDVAASLIVELDGPRAGLEEQARAVEAILNEHGAREVARAADEADRLRFWKARKSAFGAMGRIGSDLLVQDATVPRSRLPEVLGRVYEVARKYDLVITNVFHAGDGNLHPNIPFDRRDAGVSERVHAASQEIMEACVAAGGSITGEHGVGVDKLRYMSLIYSDDDLWAMRQVKEVFDPDNLCNPGKVLPPPPAAPTPPPTPAAEGAPASERGDVAAAVRSALGAECLIDVAEGQEGRPAEVVAAPASTEALAELMRLASRSGWTVCPAGRGGWLDVGHLLRWPDLLVSTRRLAARVDHRPDDLLATVEAGTTLAELNALLAQAGQWWPLDPLGGGTLGATIATASAGPLSSSYGAPRDLVLGLTMVLADGRTIKVGGRVVKNVAGYDMVKLFTGSWGTLGIIVRAHLRLFALPHADRTRVFIASDPAALAAFTRGLSTGARLAPAAAEVLTAPAARQLGIEADSWALAVRWLGHELAVADAISAAESAAGLYKWESYESDSLWPKVTRLEDDINSRLTLRIDAPPTDLGRVLRALTLMGDGEPPPLVAAPLLGRAWVFAAPGHYEAVGGEEVWATRLQSYRRELEDVGANLRVERATRELRESVDPWGEAGGVLRFNRALKARFDPGSVLKPGFFVGGI